VQSKSDKNEILIVAAEASSALYAQRLLEHWAKTHKNIHAFGVGSRQMEAAGFEIIGRAEELAVVGLSEVIRHYSKIKSVFENLILQVEQRRPNVILLLDYPDFNLRLAEKLKPLGIPIVYYISPQVWAWRKSRIHKIKKLVNKMLVLLPFEKDFYKKHDVDVEFVGHPILDELKNEHFDQKEINHARNRYGVLENETLVGLMPGSRRSEIMHHLFDQIKVAESIYETHKNVKFAILVASTFSLEEFQKFLPRYDLPLIILRDDPLKMVSMTDVVLCASGTATLIVGLLEKPMVIMYKMSFFTALLAKIFVRGTQHFGLINLVLGRRVVPELFQGDANHGRLVSEINRLIEEKDYRLRIKNELSETKLKLGDKGATVRVAEALDLYLKA
jgi:lipid-A-disaccharide synthase